MNDERLKSVLRNCYGAQAPTQEAAERIRTRVVGAPKAVRRIRIGRWIGGLVPAGAAAFFAFPVVQANVICHGIASRMEESKDFRLTVRFYLASMTKVDSDSTSIVAERSQDMWAVTRPNGPANDFGIYRGDTLYEYFAEDGRVVESPGRALFEQSIDLPNLIAGHLSEFDFKRRITHRGTVLVGGKQLNEITLETDQNNGEVTVDTDPDTGVPVRMKVNLAKQAGLVMVYDYDRDAAKASRSVASKWDLLQAAIAQGRRLDLADLRGNQPHYASAPIAKVQLGPKDRITLYRVEENSDGSVFVLYSWEGEYADSDHAGNYLRLSDPDGTKWLSSVIDFGFSKLRLNGEIPKAQVFTRPTAPTKFGPLTVFAEMIGFDPIASAAGRDTSKMVTKHVEIARVTPTPLQMLQPDWFFYCNQAHDPEWVAAAGMQSRFIEALRRKDYKTALAAGKTWEPMLAVSIPDVSPRRLTLYLGLYHAYRATGDVQTARDYLKRALALRLESGGDDENVQDLANSRRHEGMPH